MIKANIRSIYTLYGLGVHHSRHIRIRRYHQPGAGTHVRDLRMIGTVATIVAVFVGVGVISGTVSSWRQGTAWPDMWRSARAWYITWLILIIIASVL